MNKVISTNVRGISMQLAGHNRSLELCARMNYETENLDFIDSAPAGSIFYDLGACEGRFSIYAALKGLKCFSFEPEGANYGVLQENIHANNLNADHIRSFKIAISDKKQDVRIKIGQPWAGGHQKVVEHEMVRNDLKFNFLEEETVPADGLDHFIEENQLPVPEYLKVDIDGSEMPFLRGAAKTLRDEKLKHLIFELEVTDPSFQEIMNVLKGSGWTERSRFQVPNEPNLFNIVFSK